MKFVDAAPLAGTRRTGDGYLVAEVKTARTGIQDYAGHEVGKPDMPVVKVYRPADQVFSKDSLASYAHKPVTNDHPDEAVSAENWKDLAVGQIGDEVARDGEFIRIPLIVMDGEAIKAVEAGKRELSAGYTCDLAFESGVTPDGQPYDAIQKDIRINHVAIVQRGRAGSEARIGDDAHSWGVSPVPANDGLKGRSMTTRTITVDGLPVELADKDAQIVQRTIDKLTADNAALADKLSAAEKKAKEDEEEAEKKLAKKDAELDDLRGKVLDGAALDAAVQARGDLIAKAKAIAPEVKTDGLSDAAIRKAVVVAKLGDAVKDKTEAYIDARFDILSEDAAGTENLRSAISGIKPTADSAKAMNDAYSKSVSDLNAWRNQ